MPPRRPLTAKQQNFIGEYLVDFNATQAAMRAGYSKKTAHMIGFENLSKPEIADALHAARSKREAKAAVNAQWVLDKLQSNAERAMQAEPVLDRQGQPTGEYRYEGAIANRALELIGKHHGLFAEKVEVGGHDGAPIAITVTHVIVDTGAA